MPPIYNIHTPNVKFKVFKTGSPSTVVFMALIAILIFAAGCDSSTGISEPIPPVSDEITNDHDDHLSVIDGRIAFDSMDDFRKFMESIINQNHILIPFKRKLTMFRSGQIRKQWRLNLVDLLTNWRS